MVQVMGGFGSKMGSKCSNMVTPEDLNSNSSNRSNSSPVTYVTYDTIGTAGDPAPRVHSSSFVEFIWIHISFVWVD